MRDTSVGNRQRKLAQGQCSTRCGTELTDAGGVGTLWVVLLQKLKMPHMQPHAAQC
jgi:hypothetical protein